MRESAFKKIKADTKFARITKQILVAIENGDYHPGDKLPSERAIGEQMGVSRNAVREALKSLQVLEVVSSRSGDGTYITNLAEKKDFIANLFHVITESNEPAEIIDARKAFELGFIEIAIANVSLHHVQELKQSLGKMLEQASNRNYRRYLEAGREFHINLAKACANNIIEEIACILWDITNSQLSAILHEYYCAGHLNESIEIHSSILEGIERRDPKFTRQMIIKHYEELKVSLI